MVKIKYSLNGEGIYTLMEPLTEKQKIFLESSSKYVTRFGYQGELDLPVATIASLTKTEASNLISAIITARDLDIDLDEWELNTEEKLLQEAGRVK